MPFIELDAAGHAMRSPGRGNVLQIIVSENTQIAISPDSRSRGRDPGRGKRTVGAWGCTLGGALDCDSAMRTRKFTPGSRATRKKAPDHAWGQGGDQVHTLNDRFDYTSFRPPYPAASRRRNSGCENCSAPLTPGVGRSIPLGPITGFGAVCGRAFRTPLVGAPFSSCRELDA